MSNCRHITKLTSLLTLVVIVVLAVTPVHAQGKGVEVASVYDIAESEAQEGNILVTSEQGIVRAKTPYDQHLFGVVQKDPLMVYRDAEKTATPVLRNGTAQVLVSNLDGAIQSGDYITSSEITGVGTKALQSGYVIGTALTAFDGTSGTAVELNGTQYNVSTITVALRIEYAEITNARDTSRVINRLNDALLRNLQTPERFGQVFRYLFALLILFLSLAVAYFANNRASARSIEAIGRNPIAKEEIKASARLNFFFSLMIVFAGVVASILIIVL